MRSILLLIVTALLAACGHNGAAGDSMALVNGDFEQPANGADIPGWQFGQHAGVHAYEVSLDTDSPAQGKASLKMTRMQPQVYGSITQTLPLKGLVGKTVRVTAKMKSDGVGDKGWKLFMSARGQRTVVYSDPLIGTTPWKDVAIDLKITPEVDQLIVGASLLDAGTGWLDDVQVHVVD